MVLSHSRKEAVVWSHSMDQLAWHHVHNEAYRGLGGVAAVNRIDNLKTGIVHGGGACGQINEPYRVHARMLGFQIDACEIRAPEPKGKTERRVGDCKDLIVSSRHFDGLAGLESWTDADRSALASKQTCPATGLLHAMRKVAEVPRTRLMGKKYLKAGLVIIDEVGFETFSREEASLFFRLVSYGCQRGSLRITSNKAIKDWPERLTGDGVITTAILDRLLHLCHVLNIRGRRDWLRDLEDNLNGRS
jgi:hypothetical protein